MHWLVESYQLRAMSFGRHYSYYVFVYVIVYILQYKQLNDDGYWKNKKEIDEWYSSKAYDKWCERLLHITDNEHLNFVDNVETAKKDIETIKKKIIQKMGIRKDEMIQVTTFSKETIEKIQAAVAEAQKKQTLTYKIKNFFKNILKLKK